MEGQPGYLNPGHLISETIGFRVSRLFAKHFPIRSHPFGQQIPKY